MHRIVVGLDSSPQAKNVLAEAARLGRRLDAKLVLFRAIGVPLEVPAGALSARPDDVLDALCRRAKQDLEALASNLENDLLDHFEVKVGVAWQAICEAAREADAVLIVLGSHKHHGLDWLLGTTPAKVVNRAGCSVMVVHSGETARNAEPPARAADAAR